MALAAGTNLGPYEIIAPIGAGGMGEVYKARDTRLDRIVAVKISKEKFSERFEREARSIAALNHPHICQLYDVGPDYLVMEYIEGSQLQGPLPLDQTMKYAGQICDALDAAHKKGIAHRDLKPANILVTKAGVKLLDFGLARIASGSGDETVTMAVMGTPAYMAPEQWEGKPGDARSDIYAFGCVLYEMLTGKRVAQERPAVEPAAVESIIERCVEEDPDNRWQSARDVRHAMELPTASAMPVRNPWRERAAWIVVVALAVAVLALWRGRAPMSADTVSFSVYSPEGTVFSPTPNITVSVPEFALSPDGRTLAFVASATGAPPVLWVRPLAAVAARPLPGTENVQDPFWSPDSRWLGFYADGKIKKVAAAGGAVQVVAETSFEFRGGAWGPDDTILFGNGTQSISRVAAAGGPIAQIVTLDAPKGTTIRVPHFLPDGRHFLYSIGGSADRAGTYLGSLDGTTKKLLLHGIGTAVYAPPGYLLFVNGDSLMAQAFDAERLENRGQPFLVAEHVGRNTTGLSAVTASGNGTIAYARALLATGWLTWFDRGGKPLGAAGPEGDYVDFRLSPDERSVAASLVDPKAGTVDIWITDLVRGSTSRFSSGGQPIASPAWSRDGLRLVYRVNRNTGGNEFFRRSASGAGAEEPLLTFEAERAAQIRGANIVPTDWSPDGGYVLFIVSAVDSGNDLWILPLAGDKKPYKFLATPAEEMHGNFSPDGHFVAYTSNESGKFEVYVETLPRSDRKWSVSTNGGYEPRWRPDGREIYYLSEDRKLMAVSVGAGPTFGLPVPLFQTRVPAGVSANRTHYVPSRDGRRFLVNTQIGDPLPTPITVVLNWTAGPKK
jgi:Tol biopolymer transport system component/tRNA A-37 threonylcarbamoyl transferase component Bud32